MAVEKAQIRDDLELAYERFGDDGEPILLIMGLGSQMLLWHERFCQGLADRGHRVVRYDNRDVGLSSRLDHLGAPSLRRLVASRLSGRRIDTKAPYLLADMADDAARLMDTLGWPEAHIVGTSMGGMVAQEIALRHTDRVRSLTAIMTSARPAIPSTRGIRALLVRPKPGDEVEHFVRTFQTIGGPHMQNDAPRLREVGRQVHERGFSPRGFRRQLGAVIASGDRRERLKDLDVPALVIHGEQDPLVNVRMGKELARHMKNSKLVLHPDMGHDMAQALWPRLIRDISAHVAENSGSLAS